MKPIFFFFLALFAINTQAQHDSPEFRLKMKALAAKMQKTQSPQQGKKSGKIIYIINGKTYTETKQVSTTIIGGQIGDIANANHSVSIGDGELHAFRKGQSYNCKGLVFAVEGVQYSRRSKDNVATITFYDGKTVKGKFSGKVYNEKSKKTLPVSGTFETNDVTVL